MDSSVRKTKIIKISAIVLAILLVIFVALILFSKRPQTAGKGTTSVEAFNARIDYHDEMNCRVGDKKDDAYNVAATDGWEQVTIENYELNGQKTTIYIVGEKYYVKANDSAKVYNLEYLNQLYGINFVESLKLSEDDDRKIYCDSQDVAKYQIENQLSYEDLSWKEAEHEEAQ